MRLQPRDSLLTAPTFVHGLVRVYLILFRFIHAMRVSSMRRTYFLLSTIRVQLWEELTSADAHAMFQGDGSLI